jgi:hypothetical protein
MIEGAAILLIGVVIGAVLRSLPARRKAPKSDGPPEPVCGCGHHYSFHDGASGKCHGTVRQATHFNSYGTEIAWKQVPCTCRKYAGPEPMPTYYAPEIAGEPGQ